MLKTRAGQVIGTPSPLINETEAAKILGLEVTTLRRWRWAGKPPPFLKIGAAVRYDPVELSAFKEAARRTSTSDTGGAALHDANN